MILRGGLGLAAAGMMLAACASVREQTPDVANAYADHMIGRFADLNQDFDAAADRYFSALQRDPNSDTLIEGAVNASLAAGDMDRARRAARLAPRGVDAPVFAHLVRAADLMNAQHWRQADDELAGAQGAAAQELAARIMLVWARAGQGRAEDVNGDLAPLAQVHPYDGLFRYQQALASDMAGRDAEAVTMYASAADGGLFLSPAVERHAEALVRTGARDQALALLSQEEHSSNPALRAARVRIASGAAALPRLSAAQGAAIGVYGLALIYQQEHDTTDALALLTLANALDPQLDAARMTFAQAQSDLHHPDTAHAALAQIPPASPYAQAARIADAWLLVDQGRTEEALAMARGTADTGDYRAKRALADIYRQLNRYAEAEPIYTELINSDPQNWRFYFARGAARERLGRWPEAEADLRRALQLQPDQPELLNYLGYSWVDRGEHLQEGLAMIRRAVEQRPDSGAIVDSLGWAYFQTGDYTQAIDTLEHAVELMPADATLNEHLGDAYWRGGRRIEARYQWQRALSFNPENRAEIEAKAANGLPPLPQSRAANR